MPWTIKYTMHMPAPCFSFPTAKTTLPQINNMVKTINKHECMGKEKDSSLFTFMYVKYLSHRKHRWTPL